jgi:hypothetical protein
MSNYENFTSSKHNFDSLNSRYNKNSVFAVDESTRPLPISNDSRNNYLSSKKIKDWFDDDTIVNINKNNHLITITHPIGINTISSTLGPSSHDIRELITYPKNFVSPWLMSSYEPDMNIRNQSLCY